MSSIDLRSAASLLERGDYDAARRSLESLILTDRNHAAAHALLAKIAEVQTRWTDAIVHWQNAFAINPMSTEIALSFEAATLRMLSPNPARGPERNMRFVPPIEVIEPESDASGAEEKDELLDELTARAEKIVEKESPVTRSVGNEKIPEGSVPDEEDDLNRLIDELDAARLVPDPDIDPISDEELSVEIEDVVSETLAKIYASQKYFQEAGDAYLKLAVQYPARRSEFLAKADDMASRAVARN